MKLKMIPTLFEKNITRSKKDIKKFISENPHFIVNTFEDLHNYFDANMYVEVFCNDKDMDMIRANKTIDALDKYIKRIKV
tara:strand:+ start:1211 stop:1450 length:240 start_codon:yes stop_codon:yes gene_type:complete